MSKNIIAILATTTAFATPSFAADWTGFYVGAELGYIDTKVSTTIGSASEEDFVYGLIAGYDYDLGKWVIGAGIDYDFSSYDNGSSDTLRLKARAGYKLGEGLLYATAGYTHAEYKVDFAPIDLSDDGYVIGAGYEHRFKDHFSVGAEVLYADYSNFEFNGLDIESTSVQIRGAYRF